MTEGPGRFARWVIVPGAGVALAAAWIVAMAGFQPMGASVSERQSLLDQDLFARKPLAQLHHSSGNAHGQVAMADLLHACDAACTQLAASFSHGAKGGRHLAAPTGERILPALADRGKPANRFDTVAASASLGPDKLAALFKRAAAGDAEDAQFDGTEVASLPQMAPIPSRFGDDVDTSMANATLRQQLAMIQPDADASGDPLMQAPEASDLLTALPDALEAPLPSGRPKLQPQIEETAPIEAPAPKANAAKPEKPATQKQIARSVPSPRSIERGSLSQRSAPTMQAYAPPDDGEPATSKKAFGTLFGDAPRGGKGVAVYNISAGTVTMPDGQVLEAHSGIGEMADNPKYTHVKMRGPTPPDMYKLKMRERRFHGVEAIRMLPVDGKVKQGRTGILAHSELLRGRRGQSHGCVAFKDYNRFLAAFKAGKVTHIKVIPGRGGGRNKGDGNPIKVAQNGRGA